MPGLTGSDEQLVWKTGDRPIRVGLTRFGEGAAMLLLPALRSISTRAEMLPLQERLGAAFSTVAIDWRPDLYHAFLRFVLDRVVQSSATVAAGHAAGYALAQAATIRRAPVGSACFRRPGAARSRR